MKCPPRIGEALLKIVRAGILRARAASWAGDVKWCEAETDHLHNLPGLLLDYEPDCLRHYLNVERVTFRQRAEAKGLGEMPRLWEELEQAVAMEGVVGAAR